MSSQTGLGFDPRLFRRACAQFATGITVVTVTDEREQPHGLTVNSFTSVSLEPPLVLVSIDLKNAILGHFMSSKVFGINVLAEHQEELSRRFSNALTRHFDGVAWHAGIGGAPLLDGVLAHFECETVRAFEAGDHSVLLGEVKQAEFREGKPLLYFNSGYQKLQ
jgi:flavin reductase (DIM6/NTAB) family NADH-FMN oxidoreductase RutF